MTRQELHDEIGRLKGIGLSMGEIAQVLGRAKSTIYAAWTDPTGEKDAVRKAKRHGFCKDCGVRVHNSGSEPPERCRSCRHDWERTVEARRTRDRKRPEKWTTEAILDVLRSVGEDGVLTKPMYDAAYERAPRGSMPSMPTVVKRFELWANAVEAAGFRTSRNTSGPYSTRLTAEGARLAVIDCAADLGRPPSYVEYEAWWRDHGAPCGQSIRNRLGSWWAAVEVAEAYLQEDARVAA